MYKKYNNLADKIIIKIQNEVNNGKIYENQGQKELRDFEDKINKTDLTYQEKYKLKSMLSDRIDNINYF